MVGERGAAAGSARRQAAYQSERTDLLSAETLYEKTQRHSGTDPWTPAGLASPQVAAQAKVPKFSYLSGIALDSAGGISILDANGAGIVRIDDMTGKNRVAFNPPGGWPKDKPTKGFTLDSRSRVYSVQNRVYDACVTGRRMRPRLSVTAGKT